MIKHGKYQLLTTVILLLSGIILFSAVSWATPDRIPVDWMNDPSRIDSVNIERKAEYLMVDLVDLALIAGIPYRFNEGGNRMRLDFPSHQLIITARTPFVLLDGTLRQIPLEVIKSQNRMLMHITSAVELLAPNYPGEFYYDPSGPRFLIAPPRYDLLGVRFQVQQGAVRAIITSNRLLECHTEALPDGSVNILFPGGTIDTSGFDTESSEGYIRKISVIQTANDARIYFKPDSTLLYSHIDTDTDPPIYSVTFIPVSPNGPSVNVVKRLDEERENWELDLVVIDPGHGGKDPGAIGVTGSKEKDIALDVALRLRTELHKRGIRTVMTRDRDVFIPLEKRTQIANSSGGKLFISLHCNSAKSRYAKGVETYFLAPTKTENAMNVAMRENSVIKYEESRDQYRDLTEENYILLSMAQSEFLRESQAFAGILQNTVCDGIKHKNRGVDQASFYVLIGASMPSVLFEMPFISNRDEEKKLKTKAFRQKIAEEICKGVMEFLRTSHQEANK